MSQIADFKTHTLQHQLRAELMQRIETKFLLPTHQIKQCFASMAQTYTLLKIDQTDSFRYQSLYFDTDNMCFYKMHHNGQLPRHKVRIRRYQDTETSYLEIKKKNNKSVSSKHRVPIDSDLENISSIVQLVHQHTHLSLSSLTPMLYIAYRRNTLLSNDLLERVTIDTGVNFYSPKSKRRYHLGNLAIVEIKRQEKIKESYAFNLLSTQGKKAAKFSKYCVGMGLTAPSQIKTNGFKPILNRVKSLKTSNFDDVTIPPECFITLSQDTKLRRVLALQNTFKLNSCTGQAI